MTPSLEELAALLDPDAWALREKLRGDPQLEERIADSETKAIAVVRALEPAIAQTHADGRSDYNGRPDYIGNAEVFPTDENYAARLVAQITQAAG